MKRHLGRIKLVKAWAMTVLLFLALGLVTSVAVAWGATVWHSVSSADFETHSGLRGRSVLVTSGINWESQNEAPMYTLELRAGWPVHGFRFSAVGGDRRNYGIGWQFTGAIHGGIDDSGIRRTEPVDYLPWEPIYANLFLDTIFWGIMWLLLCSVGNIARLNRWIRRRGRQRCGWCGYDVRKLPEPRCPECGHAIDRWPALFKRPARLPAVVCLIGLIIVEIGFIYIFKSNGVIHPIHRAAFHGDLQSVVDELTQGVDIDLRLQDPDYLNYTPLILASFNNHEVVVEHLINSGADVTIVSEHGNVLTAAVRNRNLALVRRLIEAGVPISVQTGDAREPLIAAIQLGEVELVDMLLDAGADITMRDANGKNPLGYLLSTRGIKGERRTEIVGLLLEAGVGLDIPVTGGFGSPLTFALLAGYDVVARYLLKSGASVNDYETLADASAFPYTWTLDILVENGADLSAKSPQDGLSLLWQVYRYPQFHSYPRLPAPEVWRMLVDHGADVNSISKSSGDSILIDAVKNDRKAFAKFLLEHGADPTIVDNAGKRAVDYIDSLTHESELKSLLEEYEAKWIAEHGEGDEGRTP